MADILDELRDMEQLMYEFADSGDCKNARDCWHRWKALRQAPASFRLERTGCNLALEMKFVMEQIELIGERAFSMYSLFSSIQRSISLLNFEEAMRLRTLWDLSYPQTVFSLEAPDEYTETLEMYLLRFENLLKEQKQAEARLIYSLKIADDREERQRGLRIQRRVEQHRCVFDEAREFRSNQLSKYRRLVPK